MRKAFILNFDEPVELLQLGFSAELEPVGCMAVLYEDGVKLSSGLFYSQEHAVQAVEGYDDKTCVVEYYVETYPGYLDLTSIELALSVTPKHESELANCLTGTRVTWPPEEAMCE